MSMQKGSKTVEVVGTPVSSTSFDELRLLVSAWTTNRESRFVCVANVHMLVEAADDPNFRDVLRSADLVVPDGMPLVWMMRFFGFKSQGRMAGLDVLSTVCDIAAEKQIPVYFIGSTDEVLEKIRARALDEYKGLHIAGIYSPPFRDLSREEEEAIADKINSSEAKIVFVGLGCPKQELWMARHKHLINGVMFGIGGAFPVYAGLLKRAPRLIRNLGFEWLYRLLQEPQRLWKRYWYTNTKFTKMAIQQLLTRQFGSR